jgi:hypothetical protein
MSHKTPAIRNGLKIPFMPGLKNQRQHRSNRPSEPRYQHMGPGPFNQFQRVIAPVLKGLYVSMAQVLVISHPEGDVSVMDVVTPDGLKNGTAAGVEVQLRGGLARGQFHHLITVFKLPTQIAFQVFANHDTRRRDPDGPEGLKAFFDTPVSQVMHHFPDIRRASDVNLRKLEEFTGLRFGINLQTRFKAYQAIPDTRYEFRNTGAKRMNAFNERDMLRLNLDMEQFADVSWGTPLAEARRKMKMVFEVDAVCTADAVANVLGAAGVVEVEEVLPVSGFEVSEKEKEPTVVLSAPVAFEADPVVATELASHETIDEDNLVAQGVETSS